MKKHICSVLLLFLFWSCNSSKKDVDTTNVSVDVIINRIDLELPLCNSKEDVHQLLLKNKALVRGFLNYGIFPNLDIMENDFLKLTKDTIQSKLFEAVASEFSDISDVELAISNVYKHIKYYYPEFSEPTLFMIMSGFGGFDLNYFDSTTVVLGMESFLSDKNKFYPRRELMPYYMLRHYTKQKIPTKLSNMFAQFEFVDFDENDKTLLNRMIYWGKIYYFTEMIVPTAPDSAIMEYTFNEMARLEANKAETYNYFVTNDLLFNEDKGAERKFLGPRPTTNEIGDKAPGRVGQYLGWEIVRSYMSIHEEVSLVQLLADTDHQKIFRQARYKPKSVH